MRRHPTLTSWTLALLMTLLVTLAAGASSHNQKHKATAQLFGPTTMKGWVKFDQKAHHGNAQQRMRIKVEQGLAHQTLDVAINGVIVGTMTTNSGGTGRLRLDNQDLPEGFPCMDTGDVVTVGPLTGVFFDCGDHSAQKFKLNGQAETPEGLQIDVKYCERFKNGSLTRRFKVEVEGAAPGDTFDVTVNGAVVATITADEEGDAELQMRTGAGGNGDGDDEDGDVQPLPDTFPSLVDGDIVNVGGVDVPLSVQSNGGGDEGDQNGQGDGDDDQGDNEGD